LSQGTGTYTWQFDHLQELQGRLADEVVQDNGNVAAEAAQ
jgi:translation elongation factor EF-G